MTTGPADTTMRAAFGAALKEAIRVADSSPAAIANHVGLTVDAIRKWQAGGTAPEPITVFAVEALLELPPGDLSRHLGYLPLGAVGSVLAAIDADPYLTDRDRKLLRETYRTLRS